jgi:hypothetical protein
VIYNKEYTTAGDTETGTESGTTKIVHQNGEKAKIKEEKRTFCSQELRIRISFRLGIGIGTQILQE